MTIEQSEPTSANPARTTLHPKDERVSLKGLDPTEVLRALLATPPADQSDR